MLSSISNHQETPLSGVEVGVGGRQDLEGIDSVTEVTEKLVRACVTLWATGQNGASGKHWREQILRSSWRELAPWRSEDLNRVIQQVR